MKVWLDDTRDPAAHGRIGWVWVKTAAECIAALKTGVVKRLSLDHDLDPHASIGLPPKEPTGADVLRWMIAHPETPCDWIDLHSGNPYAMGVMGELLQQWGKATREHARGST